jgi:hypothetical protein
VQINKEKIYGEKGFVGIGKNRIIDLGHVFSYSSSFIIGKNLKDDLR